MIKPIFQNVLVVVNGSEASVHAAQYAIIMAKLYRCKLKAVYVVDTATLKQLTMRKFFVTDESSEYEESMKHNGSRYLDYVANLARDKRVAMETELRSGSVWSEVIAAAEEMKAGLIVLGDYSSGQRGSSSIKYDAVSSANLEIIRSARCSVLIAKDPNVEQLYKLV